MSSIELALAPIIHKQRVELTDLNNQLRDLNEQFPGQRKMPHNEMDPMYSAQRSPILNRRKALQGCQHLIKRQLRKPRV